MTAFETAWALLKAPLYERGDDAPKTWNHQTHSEEGYLDDFLHDFSDIREGDISWASESDDARGSASKEGEIGGFGIPHQMQGQGLGRKRLLEMIAEIQAKYPDFDPYVDWEYTLNESVPFWERMVDEGIVRWKGKPEGWDGVLH